MTHRKMVPLEERPELPPTMNWSEKCEIEMLARPHWRLEYINLYGNKEELHTGHLLMEQDTPDGAADFAWKCYENMTGLKRPMTTEQRVEWAEKWCEDHIELEYGDVVKGLMDALEAGAQHGDDRIDRIEQWYGTRWKRLLELLKEEDNELSWRASDIMANGHELRTPPTYAQQFNRLRYKKEQVEKKLARIQAWLKETRDSGHEFYKKDPNAFTHWGDLADEIDELLKVNQ